MATCSSIGMLLGYHLLWSTTANIVGTAEQAEALQEYIISNNLFLGGAVNPRDNDLTATPSGDNLIFNGVKNFNTGGVVSDLTVLEGVVAGTSDHVFTVVRTQQPGIQFAHNWDNVGLRLTESGSVAIDHVVVPWSDALGWDLRTRRPDPAVLHIPFATLLLPTYVLPTIPPKKPPQPPHNANTTEQHPTRLLQLLPRHRPGRPRPGRPLHPHHHARLALRRRPQSHAP